MIRSLKLFAAAAVLCAPILSGCMTSWAYRRAAGPLPPSFDDAAVTIAYLVDTDLILQLDGAFDRPDRVRHRYTPPRETELRWLAVHRPWLLSGLPNIIPRENLRAGDIPPDLAAKGERIRVFDLRSLKLSQRDPLMKKFARENAHGVFLVSRAEDFTANGNFYILFTEQRPKENRVDVFRIQLMPSDTPPNPAFYALLPFTLVGDLVFGLPYMLLVGISSSSSVNIAIVA